MARENDVEAREDDSDDESAPAPASAKERPSLPSAEIPADPAASRAVLPAAAPSRGSALGSRVLAYAVAAVFLFPFLAKSGIWDPYELDAADLGRRIAVRVFNGASLEIPGAVSSLPTLTDLKMGELPFTSMALGFRAFGLHDWTGRLPLAIWGFLGVVALYELIARLIDRRAGLFAAIALVTMPLYFMQARTMLGDIVTMASVTIGFAGFAGAMLDDVGEEEEKSFGLARLGWFALGLVGIAAGFMSRGYLIGVAVPTLAVGLTWLVLRGGGEGRGFSLRDGFGLIALGLGLTALGLGLYALARARPEAPLSRALGFALLRKPPTEATFDLVVRHLGHALFPWSAFLPFAIGRLLRAPVEASPRAASREIGLRAALLIGGAVAYGAFALLAPYAGTLPFAGPAFLAGAAAIVIFDFERGAPPSRALALGTLVLGLVMLADILHEPEKALAPFAVDRAQFPKSFEATGGHRLSLVLVLFAGLVGIAWFEAQPRDPERSPVNWGRKMVDLYRQGFEYLVTIWNGNLLFGLVVVEASLVGLGAMIFIGKRAAWGAVEKLPKLFADFGLNLWWIVPFVVAAIPFLLLAVRDGFRLFFDATRMSRASFTLVAALLAGGAQGFWYYPSLAAQLSPKEVFDAYARLHSGSEPLALLGVRGRAAAYYGGGEAASFSEVSRGFTWLTEAPNERRWMVVKSDDLPKLNSLYRAQNGKNLPVLDGRSSQILLVSNQLGGHENESPLGSIVLDTPPQPRTPIDAAFEDQIDVIGWEVADKKGVVVDSVVPSTGYHLRIYYRVVRPIAGNWKAFVHIDGFQRRFNGDHAVVDGKYPMNLWQPGDVVVDDLDFQLEPNFTPGDYTVYFGFFSGETRFRVARGPQHENRVVAGAIHVR
jgi:4-amino-4-deoxy-L-arabinose transferase-like glycosyltransferase